MHPLQPAPDRAWGRAAWWLVVLLLLPAPALAQDHPVPTERLPAEHTGGLWLGLYTKYQLRDSLYYYGEYHYRRRGDALIDEMGQIYLRFGLTWRVAPTLELTGGIVTPLYWAKEKDRGPGVDTVVPQYRLWQQAAFGTKLGRVRFYHQLRTEQRWARKNPVGSPFKLTYRWRYKLAAYIPINHKQLKPGTWFVSLYEEIFMQSGASIVFNHFEDNRLFGGLGYVLTDTLQMQFGHMWTYRHAGEPFRYEHRHIPRISLYHNTNIDSLLDWFK